MNCCNPILSWPDMMVSVMLRLLSDSPRDWRDDDEDVLEVSDGGRAALTGVAVGVALPLDLRRSFSAFSISISFCQESGRDRVSRWVTFSKKQVSRECIHFFLLFFFKQGLFSVFTLYNETINWVGLHLMINFNNWLFDWLFKWVPINRIMAPFCNYL